MAELANSQKFKTVTTNMGRNAVALAHATGTSVKVTHIAVGDGSGNPIEPNAAMTELVHEVFRGTVNDVVILEDRPGQFTAELIIPQNTGGFFIREVGLFLEDGTLFAVGSTPLTEKPDLSSGAASDLIIRMIIRILDAGLIEILVDPAQVLVTRDLLERRLKEHDESSVAHKEQFLSVKTAVQEINSKFEACRTNCITKIPQDIKLELSAGGSLTLKSGSKVYVPNGIGIYDEISIQNDLVLEQAGSSSDDFFLFYRKDINKLSYGGIVLWKSGTEMPEESICFWYDVLANKIKYINTSVHENYECSLPIALCSRKNGTIVQIKQIFNGAAYVDKYIVPLKGITGVYADGFQKDGGLKNTEYTIEEPLLSQLSDGTENACNLFINCGTAHSIAKNRIFRATEYFVQNNEPTYTGTSIKIWLNTLNNKTYCAYGGNSWAEMPCIFIGKVDLENGSIKRLKLNNNFTAVDRNDTEWASTQAKPSSRKIDLSVGAGQNYTAPANGHFVFWGTPVKNENYYMRLRNVSSQIISEIAAYNTADKSVPVIYIPAQKGDLVVLTFGNINEDTELKQSRGLYFVYDEGAI